MLHAWHRGSPMCYCNPQKPRVSDVTISFIVIFLTVDVVQSTKHSPHSFNSLSGHQMQDTEEDMRKHEPCKNFGNFTVSGGWKTFMVGNERTIGVLKKSVLSNSDYISETCEKL